jgi:hypothetical protein
MVNPSPTLITPNHHPDFIRVIKSPNLKDSFVEANQLMDQPGVRGVVWVPETPQVKTLDEIYDEDHDLRLWGRRNFNVFSGDLRLSTVLEDVAGKNVDRPHVDGYGSGSNPKKVVRCVYTPQAKDEHGGTILYSTVPTLDLIDSDGFVRENARDKLGAAWQVATRCAYFGIFHGPLEKQAFHHAPKMQINKDKKDITGDAIITRTVNVYNFC